MSLQTSPSGVIAISAILPAIGIVAVALRFYTRYQQKTSLAIDDWLTLPALVCEILIIVFYQKFSGLTSIPRY